MEYKNHQIEISVVGTGSGWTPDVFVIYSENGKNVLESLRMDQTFATPDEAEQNGIEYAKSGSMTETLSRDPPRVRAKDG